VIVDPERQPESAFAVADIGWVDFETRSDTDIDAGTYRYATEADAIVMAYAIGDGPVRSLAVRTFGQAISWDMFPTEVRRHNARVIAGEAVWAAWNMGFDRAVWNYATPDFPPLEPHHTIDVMAQAVASGLPPDLATAAQWVGRELKDDAGKDLIALFCTPKGLKGVRGTPQSHPAEWAIFRDQYATADIEAMRSVYKATRRLPLAEWREYWAMEAINERGIGIDRPLVEAAAKLAAIDKVRSAEELSRLTGGEVTTVDQVKRITDWLLLWLPPEGRIILTERKEETDEDGVIVKPAKFALTRKRIERLLAFLGDLGYPDMDDLTRVLQIRQYGGSKTPAKFAKMLAQETDGILRGQYVFNGAPQTGRASSKGVQIHNLARDVLADEPDMIEAVLGGAKYDDILRLGEDTPVARKLSLLIRPSFVPRGDRVFVWSDWSQIEARIVPWLCDHMAGARARVQIFRDVDADPSLPDLYTRTAAELSHVSVEQVTKPMRQRGKVAELALGFCGGIGALQAMGAGYGLHFSDDDAQQVVDRWREANPWAIDYSREIWEAMRWCTRGGNAGKGAQAGRVILRFEPHYFGGSLLARLPSGRILTYRGMRWEDVDVLDADDKPTGLKKTEMMFSRGYGRVKLWPGMFVENFTQATAADFLRGTLMRLEDNRDWMPVRLHTHDEILVETTTEMSADAMWCLGFALRQGFDWSIGLPLMSEETIGYCYTKHEGSHGL